MSAVTPVTNIADKREQNRAERIREADTRRKKAGVDWIDASLALAVALREARDDKTANVRFGQWLKDNDLVRDLNKDDRAALLNLSNHPDEMRRAHTATKSASYQLLWRDVSSRLLSDKKTGSKKEHSNTEHNGKKRRAPKSNTTPVTTAKPRASGKPLPVDVAREIVRPMVLADQTADPKALSKQHGISHVTFEKAFAVERAVRDALTIDVNTLPDREKVDIAIRQERKKLEAEFDDRLKRGVSAEFKSIMMREFDEGHEGNTTDAERWQWSLANFAGHALSLSGFWDREFGKAWRSYLVAPDTITLAEQAATMWQELADELKKRRRK